MPRIVQAVRYVCDVCQAETEQAIIYHLYVASSGHAQVGGFGAEEEEMIACSGEHAMQVLQDRLKYLEAKRQQLIASAEAEIAAAQAAKAASAESQTTTPDVSA